jgi:Bax protein
VSQPTGIAINNTHLLRAAMLFMVLGVIGPGLFQLKPPQWFDASGGTGHLDMAAQVTAQSDQESAFEPVISAPPAAESADPSAEVEIAAVPAPESPPANTAAQTADSQAPRKIVPEAITPAPDSNAAPPNAKPEQPAVAARKARPEPSTESAAAPAPPTPRETQVASLTSRTAKVPAIPGAASLPLVVTRDFAKQIPQSHVGLPVKRQKESFIGITLPLILAANEEISQRRKAIERAVSRGDQATVERWARLYRIETEDRPLEEIERKLLLRADFVPVSLALAQAAIESGWGTSRFALQGNALFGQWAWQKDAGLKPARASNSQAVVRSFPNLFGSVRAYMHNLNTHPRYAAFRARRHLLRGRTKADLGYQLSNFLDGYAEIGEVYVAKLKTLIRSNDLGRYEVAKLR